MLKGGVFQKLRRCIWDLGLLLRTQRTCLTTQRFLRCVREVMLHAVVGLVPDLAC